MYYLQKEEITYYNSQYAAQENLIINAGLIKMIAENINNCKSAFSKNDNNQYTFQYINEDQLRENYISSSKTGPKRQKLLTEEEKKYATSHDFV